MTDAFKGSSGILRLLIIINIMGIVALIQIYVGQLSPNWPFLVGSALIVLLALLNYLDIDDDAWKRFGLLMFVAMLVCFIADLLMAGVFYIIPGESLINGVIFFLMGHILYLFALRDRSSLLLRSESPKLITRNLGIWLGGMVVLFVLFFLTLYNPEDMIISFGLLVYGVFLTSSLVFSITKWFDDFPRLFSVCLILGFFLFFISDYILGYKIQMDAGFLSGIEAVGITYLLGQMIIHLAPLSRKE